MNEKWYLLYGGTSEDGRGRGNYVGRTMDVIKAYQHFRDCKDNPYSTGYVLIVTDNYCLRAISDMDFE